MLLVKLPFAEPSVVCDPETAGLCDVPQHTPLTVIVAPPFEEIDPPDVAEVLAMADAAVVVNVGAIAVVVNVRSLPYAVPALLVAYALTW
jgi:hypothetical protein